MRFEATQEAINTRMTSPNISTILDTDSIAFTKYVVAIWFGRTLLYVMSGSFSKHNATPKRT